MSNTPSGFRTLWFNKGVKRRFQFEIYTQRFRTLGFYKGVKLLENVIVVYWSFIALNKGVKPEVMKYKLFKGVKYSKYMTYYK